MGVTPTVPILRGVAVDQSALPTGSMPAPAIFGEHPYFAAGATGLKSNFPLPSW